MQAYIHVCNAFLCLFLGQGSQHSMYEVKLTRPKRREPTSSGFSQISAIPVIKAYEPYKDKPEITFDQPRRKSMQCPDDNGTFVKPLKQSFIRNPRLMPMTRMMLALLAGWDGKGQGAIRTTTGILAKQLGRSNRMVFNYLQDAMEEGYLIYSRIKDRMGYYIGIKITLNSMAIRKEYKPKKPQSEQEMAEARDRKYSSEIKPNYINKKEIKVMDEEIYATMARWALKAGFLDDDLRKVLIE